MRLCNHNAWTEEKILDFDSLGAGGSRRHLIIFNTQKYLGYLMSKPQLWDLLGSISNFDQTQKKEPTKVFIDEYERLSNGGKVNSSFMYSLRPSGSGYGEPILGKNFESNIKDSLIALCREAILDKKRRIESC